MPAHFPAQKVRIVILRQVSVMGQPPSPQLPQSRTFNGGEGIMAIHQPSYSLNTATADFFLFQGGEVRAGRPLVVP